VNRARRVSPAYVVSILALIVAATGGAYAASVAKNSVTSKAIKNGAVKGVDVKDNSLTGADIQESTLDGAQGPIGPAGPAGPTGPAGPSASTFAARSGQNSVDFAGTAFARVVELDASSPTAPLGETSLGKLSVSFPARINLTATVTFTNSGTTAPDDAAPECRLELFPAGPTGAEVGRPVTSEVEANNGHNEDGSLTLIATVDRPAGAYDADVICRDNQGANTLRAKEASLQAIATAQ
jgi:hypothetical protein